MIATFCALALLANGTGALFAQTQQKTRQAPPPPPPTDHGVMMIERRDTMVRIPGMPPPPPHEGEFFQMQIAPGAPPTPGESFSFSFMSSDMHFDSKVVKGAPYSAESVTESVQLLADGNRITHTSKASLYRDGEGRVRRDQTLNHIGPWATSDEPAQSIFINDPVAGARYILNPRTRTAQKLSNVMTFSRVGEGKPLSGDAPHTQVFMRSRDGAVAVAATPSKGSPLQGGGLSGKAVKRVPPTYPAVAKAAGAQGPVTVQIVVNEAGEVESAKADSGHPLLQSAAVDAARQWQFSPTKLSGNAVKVSGTISFVFSLPKEEEAGGGLTYVRVPGPRHGVEGERVKVDVNPVRESLGKQMIEGVEAEGTRTTITFPAGMMGNERPINVVSERWYSPELQTVVLSKHSDPRFGETTLRLVNINRGEPARTLFEVPSDYAVKEGRQIQRMRHPEQK
jgi:TonB family protein